MSTPYYDYEQWCDRVSRYEYNQSVTFNMPIEITSYDQALDWYDRRKGLWSNSKDRPIGKSNDYTRRMRMLTDDSIEFEYNQHVLCVWHKDNTLTVNPYDGYRSGYFDRFVMPRTIEAGAGARTGKIIFLKPDLETQRAGKAKWDRIQIEGIHGKKLVANPEILVVRAEKPVTLKPDVGERWAPVSEMRCKPFYWYELDKGRLREASRQYNIPEFVTAIETAIQMGADIQTSKAYDTLSASRQTSSGEDILTLLEQERYVEAAALVRPAEDRYYDQATGKYVVETKGLNSTDIKKMRQLAYVEMGLIYLESERVVTLPQFNNIERKLLDFGVPAE